ncbi:hypothetical protein RQP46_007693 [Phenoliferia psychrophenolica]
MLLPGSKMQISYTFLNYLHSTSRLLTFISLATFTPSRREFADYLGWCARRVEAELRSTGGSIFYGEEVLSISHVKAAGDAAVRLVCVTSRDVATGAIHERLARNLMISTGGSPRMPMELGAPDLLATGRVLHSSEFLHRIDRLLDDVLRSPPTDRPIRLAVIGGGQSSTEIFLGLRSRLAERAPSGDSSWTQRPRIDMFLRKMALKATEESQFANEVFDPAMSQAVFQLAPSARETVLQDSRSTNYSVVNPRTLTELYETMYDQRVADDIATRDGQQIITDPLLAIHPYSRLSSSSPSPSSGVVLTFLNTLTGVTSTAEFDAVLCGTGSDYQPTTAPSTPPSRHSFAHRESSRDAPPFDIQENYRLALPSHCEIDGAEVPFEPTVWLQGCNERTHGVSDSLLSVLAVRSGEILEGILTEGAK